LDICPELSADPPLAGENLRIDAAGSGCTSRRPASCAANMPSCHGRDRGRAPRCFSVGVGQRSDASVITGKRPYFLTQDIHTLPEQDRQGVPSGAGASHRAARRTRADPRRADRAAPYRRTAASGSGTRAAQHFASQAAIAIEKTPVSMRRWIESANGWRKRSAEPSSGSWRRPPRHDR